MENYNDDYEQSSWMSIADAMSALMMIFMFIAVIFLYQLLENKELYRLKLNQALHKEFDKDLDKWQAYITDDNIIRFASPFDVGKDTLPENYMSIMEDFFPRYIYLLSKKEFKSEIDEIRVEGHTSNGWGDLTDEREIYLNNMNLSQRRANNVLSFCYTLDSISITLNQKWLEKKLRANGMSYSKPIMKSNIIDNDNSRRVEFRVITKEHS